MKLNVFVVCTVLSVSVASNAGEPRTWTSKDGQFTLEAELIGFGAKGVKLKKKDGSIVNVLPNDLSEQDRKFARTEFKKNRDRPSFGFTHVNLNKFKTAVKDKDLTLPSSRIGVVVVEVIENSPASIAGLQTADIITHINDQPVTDVDRFTDIAITLEVGQNCEIKYCRPKEDGKKVTWPSSTCTVTLGAASELEKSIEDRKLAEAKKCPLEITSGNIVDNIIGVPDLAIELTNVSSYDVVAYVVEAECFNSFDDPVRRPGSNNIFRGIGQSTIERRTSDAAKWQLSLQDTTTRAVVRVVRVKLANGDEWNEDPDNKVSVTVRAEK
jgi:hypothetical protein